MPTRPVALALWAVLSLVAAAPVDAAPAAAPRSAWAQEGHDAGRTSWNPEEDVLVAATVADARPLWRAPRPVEQGGSRANDGSEPVVADGKVFVQDGGRLYAYAADGCGQAAGRRCPPRWVSADLGIDGATPAYAGGSLLVASPPAVVALDPRTGAERWRVPLDPPPPHAGHLDLAAAGGLGYLSVGEQVTVFDVDGCGAPACPPLWSVRVDGAAVAEPTVAGGVLYVRVAEDSGATHTAAFDAAGCGEAVCSEPAWRTASSEAFGSVAVNGTTLFQPRYDRRVAAFPAAGCGEPVCQPTWTTTAADYWFGSLAVTEDWLVAGWGDGVSVFAAGGCGAAECPPRWTGADGGYEVSVAGDLVWTREISADDEVSAYPLVCRRHCEGVGVLDYRATKRAGHFEGAAVVVDGRAYVHYVTGIVVYGLPHDLGTGP